MTEPRNTHVSTLLEARGVKPTPNRLLVARELANASRPLSIADFEAAFDFTVDRASIFRVLELFAEKDVVHVIEDGSRALKYELCQNAGCHSLDDHHVHFYCESCKETFCFDEINVPPIDMPEGFHPRSVNYMLKGLCPRCARRQQ